MCPGSEWASVSIKGGDDPRQIPQIISWIRVQKCMMKFSARVTINHLILPLGAVTLKAKSTVTVLAKTAETATVKRTPNVVFCKIHVARLVWLMESKEKRKQKVREIRT